MTHSSQAGLASLRHAGDWKHHVTARAEQDTRNRFALTRIEQVTDRVIDAHAGHIGTHYETCWQNHAGCLAVLINDILKEEA